MQVIAESLSEEEIAGLKEMFKMIDTDNSGTITLDELKDGLRQVGSDLMDHEIVALMDAVRISNATCIIDTMRYHLCPLPICGSMFLEF
jgi:calcium-dependent protein kinase